MLVTSFLSSIVDLKEAQNEFHSIISPLKVGTLMVGKLFRPKEPQQVGLEDDELDVEEWLSDLLDAMATSDPRVARALLEESSSALLGWSLGRLAVCHWLLKEENS